jgi:hypothetical protein
MTGHASAPQQIDPRLVECFALFREPGPGPDGPLDEADVAAVARCQEFAVSDSRIRERLARHGLVFSEVRRVVLDAEHVILVIPGSVGMQVLVRTGQSTGGSVGRIDGRLDGRPILSSNQTFFGLAPHGVELQHVEFRDGSAGEASVRHNVYMIDDPSWSPASATTTM